MPQYSGATAVYSFIILLRAVSVILLGHITPSRALQCPSKFDEIKFTLLYVCTVCVKTL